MNWKAIRPPCTGYFPYQWDTGKTLLDKGSVAFQVDIVDLKFIAAEVLPHKDVRSAALCHHWHVSHDPYKTWKPAVNQLNVELNERESKTKWDNKQTSQKLAQKFVKFKTRLKPCVLQPIDHQ